MTLAGLFIGSSIDGYLFDETTNQLTTCSLFNVQLIGSYSIAQTVTRLIITVTAVSITNFTLTMTLWWALLWQYHAFPFHRDRRYFDTADNRVTMTSLTTALPRRKSLTTGLQRRKLLTTASQWRKSPLTALQRRKSLTTGSQQSRWRPHYNEESRWRPGRNEVADNRVTMPSLPPQSTSYLAPCTALTGAARRWWSGPSASGSSCCGRCRGSRRPSAGSGTCAAGRTWSPSPGPGISKRFEPTARKWNYIVVRRAATFKKRAKTTTVNNSRPQ